MLDRPGTFGCVSDAGAFVSMRDWFALEGGREMAKNLRIALFLGMTLTGAAWTSDFALADVPQYCRDLAAQYATAPDQMDANALAALRACETAASQERPDAQSPADPSGQQPDSPGVTSLDQPGWGQWSPSASWSDDRAKTTSWGDHVPE